MTVDLKKRMVELKEQGDKLKLEAGPLERGKRFILHPSEVPWWGIRDPEERRIARKRQYQRVWYEGHPGAAAGATRKYKERHPKAATESLRRFRERNPEAAAEYERKYKESHPGVRAKITKRFKEKHPEAANEAMAKFYSTPKGKALTAKRNADRRERSTNPELYAARVELLHTLQESCAKCRATFKVTHQIDHIVPLCLGGTDNWENLQPLCLTCHRKKTGEDIREFMMCRKENK